VRCKKKKKKKNSTKHNHILRPPQPNREQPYPPPAATNPTKIHHKINKKTNNQPSQTNETHHKINKNLPPQTNNPPQLTTKNHHQPPQPSKNPPENQQKTHQKINKPHNKLTKREIREAQATMASHIGREREREIGEDDAVSESIAMLPANAGDPREAASLALALDTEASREENEVERGAGGSV
jgi:hypothetical protein